MNNEKTIHIHIAFESHATANKRCAMFIFSCLFIVVVLTCSSFISERSIFKLCSLLLFFFFFVSFIAQMSEPVEKKKDRKHRESIVAKSSNSITGF